MENFTEFIYNFRLQGLLIGLSTFIIIGLFHPMVIKGEYYLGEKMKWIFLAMGIAFLFGAVMTEGVLVSSLLGVASFSSFWGIKEVGEQVERVRKGWFPSNPKRLKKENYSKELNKKPTSEI